MGALPKSHREAFERLNRSISKLDGPAHRAGPPGYPIMECFLFSVISFVRPPSVSALCRSNH